MSREVRIILVSGDEGIRATRPMVERLMTGVEFNSPILFTMDDIYERLCDGRFQLWLFHEPEEAPHLFAVTSVENYPQGSIAHIVIMAGRHFRHAMAFAPRFEEWARQVGAQYVHFECSPGMAGVMKRLGYSAVALAVYKPLYVAN